MAMPSAENSDQPAAISTDADQREHDNLVPNSLNHEVAEPMPGIAEAEEEVTEPKPGIAGAEEEVTEPKPRIAGAEEEVRGIAEEEEEVRGFSEDEVRGVLEVIASTGKFWHDWDKLRSMISFYLKQVLSEYPEAKTTTEEQNAKLGETYPELVKRLDEALHSFEEGPPFTLQRLCEILLSARSIYPNLSKLALALEKNLLVTSTLTVSTDPYPQAMQKQYEPDEAHEEPQLQPSSMENGIEPMAGDGDEIMAEVQEADIDDDMTIDMEAFEEIVGSSEQNSTLTGSS